MAAAGVGTTRDALFGPEDGAGAAAPLAAPRPFIDAHAHVFNGKDLPVVAFLYRVLLQNFEGHGAPLPLLIIGLIRDWVLASAPTAIEEQADLDNVGPGMAMLPSTAASLDRTAALQEFLSDVWTAADPSPEAAAFAADAGGPVLPGTAELMSPPRLAEMKREAIAMVAAAHGPELAARLARAGDFAGLAQALETSGVGGLIEWAQKFGRKRLENVQELSDIYAPAGGCRLVAPALVDYGHWLLSPPLKDCHLHHQTAVMGAISRRHAAPRVHGFVAFDPLKAALWTNAPNGLLVDETGDPGQDPHEVVREAVEKHGFLGVKLYPPMGFRALGNAASDMSFHDEVKRRFGVTDMDRPKIDDRTLGGYLDDELKRLYLWCAEKDVPILAHGYNSNGAGKGYGQRASPTYWRNAIEFVRTSASLPPERRRLRLCLAHYGGFDAHAPGSTCIDLGWTQKTWELIFSGLIAGPSGEFVFADLSYLSILLEDTAEAKACRGRLAKLLKEHYVAQRDPECRHLVFGSDWIMLGKERNHAEYHDRLARFLRREAGLGDAQLANIFRRNAMRLFALGPGGQGRQRLESFYGGEAAALVADLDAMA